MSRFHLFTKYWQLLHVIKEKEKKKEKKREKKRHACTIALCVEKGYVVCLNNVKKQQHEVGKQNPRIIDNLSLCEAVAL